MRVEMGARARGEGEGEGTPLQIELDVDDLHEVLHRVVLEVEAVPGNGGTQGSRWARTAEWWVGGDVTYLMRLSSPQG